MIYYLPQFVTGMSAPGGGGGAFIGVCLSKGGVCVQEGVPGQRPPCTKTPRDTDTFSRLNPPRQRTPWTETPPKTKPPPRTVKAGGTHPTGIHPFLCEEKSVRCHQVVVRTGLVFSGTCVRPEIVNHATTLVNESCHFF